MSVLQTLEPPDSHYVQAAMGWLELGNASEASLELSRVREEMQCHPEFLLARWDIFADQRQWENGLQVAKTLTQLCPEISEGWVKQSFCLHELKRTEEAWDSLWEVADLFPANTIIPYNLACYACQLGRETTAVEWIHKAIEVAGKTTIIKMARGDSDLKPIWDKISKI